MLNFHQVIHQETLFNCVPLISKAGIADRLFNFCLDPININSVFVMLRVNLLARSQRFIFDKSWFKEASMEKMSLSAYVRWVSSAYILGWELDKQLGKSLIYKRNSKGPSIVPWRIPQVNVQGWEMTPLTAHLCVRLSK